MGEKLYEELMTEQESAFAYENEEMFIVYPPHIYDTKNNHQFTPPDGFTSVPIGEFSSFTARCIDEKEIEQYFIELKL